MWRGRVAITALVGVTRVPLHIALEEGTSAAEDLADVPASSRARWSATPVGPTVGLSADTTAVSAQLMKAELAVFINVVPIH